MSVIIIIQQPELVSLITDTGQYDPDNGSLVAKRSKVLVFPNAPVAFAWRGDGGDWPDMIYRHCQHLRTMEEIVVAASRYAGALLARAPAGEEWLMECYFAGVFKSQIPGCVWFTNLAHPIGEQELRPLAIRTAPLLAVNPAFGEPLPHVLGWSPTEETWDDWNPPRDGLAMIEAVRRTPQQGGMIVAAGAAELTQVWRDGRVNRFVLRDWGDPIGRPVQQATLAANDLDDVAPTFIPTGTIH